MAHQEQLSNGLNVVSFKQAAEDFGAVFVVPTPAVDSSGIAHLVEHLVFRTSDRPLSGTANTFRCKQFVAA